MHTLTVNAGSTSVRLGLYLAADDGKTVSRLAVAKREARPGQEAAVLDDFLAERPGPIARVVHRIVHAGPGLRETCRFDDAVRRAIAQSTPLAPLHNPPALAWAEAAATRLPDAVHLAAFDSAFFRALPPVATTYALPAEIAARAGIVRLGFHGFAHASMFAAFRRLRPDRSARVISLQLGGGCSATALRDGVPVDTSMGATPLEGLVMATRPGDLDPGALALLLQHQADSQTLWRLLNEASGLRGISGLSGDVRSLLESDTPAARLALDVYCHRIRKYIGAYWAVLGGCDAVLVGGGAGEGAPQLRAQIFRGLEDLGFAIDEAANATAVAPAKLSRDGSAREIWVIPTDEETELAREGAGWKEGADQAHVEARLGPESANS
ncbi:MAG TPA: acetate/propionate family kinase [Polyangia bacterium]